MTETEDIYLAPETEIDADHLLGIQAVVDEFRDFYLRRNLMSGFDSSIFMEFSKAAGYWKAASIPLTSLSVLLRESIGDYESVSDLTLRASMTLAACDSIQKLMLDVLQNAFVIQMELNESKALTSHLADQAEDMLQAANLPLPNLQLELFED